MKITYNKIIKMIIFNFIIIIIIILLIFIVIKKVNTLFLLVYIKVLGLFYWSYFFQVLLNINF